MSRPAPRRHQRLTGAAAVVAVLAVALFIGALNVVPVESQTLRLEALEAPTDVAVDAPWHWVWDRAPSQEVALSAQNIAPPFGGGTVEAVTVRALHDGERLYLLLEWADAEPDDTVNDVGAFSDAAAVQFPAAAATSLPPFTMGMSGSPVNIWQWKAVWQTDIDAGFTTQQDRYPNSYVDGHPNADDPLYRTAAHVGNPMSQLQHDSPVENMIAEGFGTLTHADLQDVAGSGEWREGHWRALFVRALDRADDGQAAFELGATTNVAFAVWDGGSGDRDGVKSIAPFIELSFGDEVAGGENEFGAAQVLIAAVIAVTIAAAASVVIAHQHRAAA